MNKIICLLIAMAVMAPGLASAKVLLESGDCAVNRIIIETTTIKTPREVTGEADIIQYQDFAVVEYSLFDKDGNFITTIKRRYELSNPGGSKPTVEKSLNDFKAKETHIKSEINKVVSEYKSNSGPKAGE